MSDKEAFVVLPEGMFNKKADAALDQKFKWVDVLKNAMVRAQDLCVSLSLSQLRARIKKSEGLNGLTFLVQKQSKNKQRLLFV